MSARAALNAERVHARARVGSLAESAENTSNALTLLTWIAGIGFVAYATLNWILPAVLGAATKTRRAVGDFRQARVPSSSATWSSPMSQRCAVNPAAAECIGI